MLNFSRPSFAASAVLVSAEILGSLDARGQEPLSPDTARAKSFLVQFPDGTTLRYQGSQSSEFRDGEVISILTEQGERTGTVRLEPPRASSAPSPAPLTDLVLPPAFSETAKRRDEFSLEHAERVVAYSGIQTARQEILTIVSNAHADFSESWLGVRKPLPTMSLRVEIADVPAQGTAQFAFTSGPTPTIDVVVKGRIHELPTVLRHELMHVVLRSHFGLDLPRWVDEGVATSIEFEGTRHPLIERLVTEYLPKGQGFSFAEIITTADLPPQNKQAAFYSQSTSMVEDLVRIAPGRTIHEQRQYFMSFVRDTIDRGATFDAHWKALAAKYPFGKISEFQTWWVDDLARRYLHGRE